MSAGDSVTVGPVVHSVMEDESPLNAVENPTDRDKGEKNEVNSTIGQSTSVSKSSAKINNDAFAKKLDTSVKTTNKDKFLHYLYISWIVVKTILRVSVITIQNLIVMPGYLILVPILYVTVRVKNPQLFWKIEGTLFRLQLTFVASWLWNAGYKVVEAGENLEDIYDDEALVIANHQSTADVAVMFYILQSMRDLGGRVVWIMDRILRYTHFGLVSTLRNDFFILQMGDAGKGKNAGDQRPLLKTHMQKYFWSSFKQWIVLFPEGGFLHKRRERSQKYALKNNYPVLEHVTLPRMGAMQALLETMSPQGITAFGKPNEVDFIRPLRWLVDVTIAYEGGQPLDIQTIILGHKPPQNITCYYRKFPITDIPLETEAMQVWMNQRYVEKEALLKHFYDTGKFPENAPVYGDGHGDGKKVEILKPAVIPISNMYVLFISLVCFIIAYTEYRVISETFFVIRYLLRFIF